MNVSGIGSSIGAGLTPATDASKSSDGGGFGALLNDLTSASAGADQAVVDISTGANTDLHDAVLAVESESLAFDLAVQIRNRLVDMYQEVFRMQI